MVARNQGVASHINIDNDRVESRQACCRNLSDASLRSEPARHLSDARWMLCDVVDSRAGGQPRRLDHALGAFALYRLEFLGFFSRCALRRAVKPMTSGFEAILIERLFLRPVDRHGVLLLRRRSIKSSRSASVNLILGRFLPRPMLVNCSSPSWTRPRGFRDTKLAGGERFVVLCEKARRHGQRASLTVQSGPITPHATVLYVQP
jgi:hypothetical protein